MPHYFHKPENALKRAHEFIAVDKKGDAVEILADVMKSKKHRTWQKIHESIMSLFVQLCVELKKSLLFKEVIHQYKNMVTQVNPKTLEDMVRKYLSLAEKMTDEARTDSHTAVQSKSGVAKRDDVVDNIVVSGIIPVAPAGVVLLGDDPDAIDDLDQIETPESLMMSAVSGESAQDRSDRTILTPWLKFLWESYRQTLDMLKNNNKFERLYHDVAQMAYEFCRKYNRKTEYRKLCDILRNHLARCQSVTGGAVGQAPSALAVNLNNPDTQAMHLETRLKQLEHSMSLELYMEAFKAVEDIWGLVTISKKSPKPSLMANYYNKVSLVLWKCSSHLFHAAALHKLFNLIREQKKNIATEELSALASRVLCATLAVPLPTLRDRNDSLLESGEIVSGQKQKVLSSLLGLTQPPTRSSLVRDTIKAGVPALVAPQLASLYHDLEVVFQPLKLADKTAPAVAYVRDQPELEQYAEALQSTVVTRTIIQVSQMYESIEISRFSRLCPFAEPQNLELAVADLARNLQIPVRLDHRRGALIFGGFSDMGISRREESNATEEGVEIGGPVVRTSDQLSGQLVSLGRALTKVLTIIRPDESERLAQKNQIIANVLRTSKETRDRLLRRRNIIEERIEQLERMSQLREQEVEERKVEEQERAAAQEDARLKREATQREAMRQEEERKNMQRKVKLEHIEQLKQTAAGAKAFAGLKDEEMEDTNVEEMLAKHLEKEKKELAERCRNQEKKVDHMARARRLEELPLLQALSDKESASQRELFEGAETKRLAQHRADHQRQLLIRSRLLRILTDQKSFSNQVLDSRETVYKEAMDEWEKKLEDGRKKLLNERAASRREERRLQYIQHKRDEIERERIAAEEEKQLAEKQEAERLRAIKEQEYAEHKARLELQAQKQQERDRAIEEKLRGGGSSTGASQGTTDAPKWRPSAGTTWRDREQKKEDSFRRPVASEQAGNQARDPARDRDGGERGWRGTGASSSHRDGDDRYKRDTDSDRYRRDDRDRDGGSSSYRRDDRDRDGGSSSYRRDDRDRDGGSSSYRRDDRDRNGGSSTSYRRDDRVQEADPKRSGEERDTWRSSRTAANEGNEERTEASGAWRRPGGSSRRPEAAPAPRR